jgi:hypothetical protein
MNAGEPRLGAYSDEDRVLPGSSPTANLVGVWKGKRLKFETAVCRWFFIFCPAPLERRIFTTQGNSSRLTRHDTAIILSKDNFYCELSDLKER